MTTHKSSCVFDKIVASHLTSHSAAQLRRASSRPEEFSLGSFSAL